MGHDHHHHRDTKNLRLAFFLNLIFTIIEIIGGLMVNSIAIISDAVHDLGDSLALGTSWYLQNKSKQKANHKYSFGYARFSLLGALINSIILISGSVYVISEAIARIQQPEESNARGMILFAILGVLVNGYAAWKLSKGESMNEKMVSWHLLEDVLGWAAILVVAIILLFWNNLYLDPVLSLLISAFILWNVLKRLRETLFLFLQGTPREIDLKAIEKRIVAFEEVDSVHHTHVWSLEGAHHVFSTHIKLNSVNKIDDILLIKQKVKSMLKDYHFKHVTIETELTNEVCEYRDYNG